MDQNALNFLPAPNINDHYHFMPEISKCYFCLPIYLFTSTNIYNLNSLYDEIGIQFSFFSGRISKQPH